MPLKGNLLGGKSPAKPLRTTLYAQSAPVYTGLDALRFLPAQHAPPTDTGQALDNASFRFQPNRHKRSA
jgi:hypothetical protein